MALSEAQVIGVDGCRDGWVGVVTCENRFLGAGLYPDIQELAAAWPEAAVVAIDMPLSFPEKYPRPADMAARNYLKGKAPSLFLTVPREVLEESTYEKALKRARRMLDGKGIAVQSYGLREKILECQDYLESSHDRRLFEMHPEVSFRVMAEELGQSIQASKKSWNGFRERLEALSGAGLTLPTGPQEGLDRAGVDDFLDAAVGAWTARRIHLKKARSFPEDLSQVEERSPSGRKGAIWV